MIVIEAGFSGTDFPLDTPRVAAHAISGTVAASTEAAGFAASFAANLMTYQWWRPTAVPATWDLSFSSAPVSYIAIVAHDCATVGATVEVQRWTGSVWVTMASHVPTDNGPILFLLVRRSLDRFRVRVSGAIPTIGVIMGGDVIELPQRSKWVGAVPFDIANQNEYRDTLSEGGQVLDRFMTRRSIPARMEIDHLSETWCDAKITPLRSYAEGAPILIADRPLAYPRSVAFGYVKVPIQPVRAIPNQRVAMSVAIEVIGHVGT